MSGRRLDNREKIIMSFTIYVQPLFEGWKFSIIDSPIGHQCIINKYDVSSVVGRILEYGYENYYQRDLSSSTPLQLLRINNDIPHDTEEALYQQLGITPGKNSPKGSKLPFIRLEIQEPPDLSIPTELLSFSSSSSSSTSSSSSSTDVKHTKANTTTISARASRAAYRTRESSSSSTSALMSGTNKDSTSNSRKRRKNNSTTTTTDDYSSSSNKMAIVDLTFDDHETGSYNALVNENTDENTNNDDKVDSDKDSMEIEDTTLSRLPNPNNENNISSSAFSSYLSKQSSNISDTSSSTIQRSSSSSPSILQASTDNTSSSSLSSLSAVKPSKLTMNQVVQVPPFGYGHIIAIKELHRNLSSTPIVIDDEDSDIVVPSRTDKVKSTTTDKSTTDPVYGYTVDLWSGIKAYVTSDNPLWSRYCKNISDKTIARYPSWNSRGAVTLNLGDVYRLTPTVYLNDNTIEFYLRYTHTEKLLAYHRTLSHVYGTFFYPLLGNRLRSIQESWLLDPAKPFPSGTVTVKSIADIDPFSYQFLFIPINDKIHWSTAVVCYPGLLLPGRDGRGKIPLLQTSSRVNSSSSTTIQSQTSSSLLGLSAVPNVTMAQSTRSNSSSSTIDNSVVVTDHATNTNDNTVTSTENEPSITTSGARRVRKPKASTETVTTPVVSESDNLPSPPTVTAMTSKRTRKRDTTIESTEINEDFPPKKIPNNETGLLLNHESKGNKRKSSSTPDNTRISRTSSRKADSKVDSEEISTKDNDGNDALRSLSKKRGRRSTTETESSTKNDVMDAETEIVPLQRRSTRNKTESTTEESTTASTAVTIDIIEIDSVATSGRNQLNPQLSEQLYKLFESSQEINTQLAEAFHDKLKFSLTNEFLSTLFPPMEEVSPSVIQLIRSSKESSNPTKTTPLIHPKLIPCNFLDASSINLDILMNELRKVLPGNSNVDGTIFTGTESNQRTVGDDLDRELVFDYTNINLKDEKEYFKYRNLLQQERVSAEDRMKIRQNIELTVMNRVALDAHKKSEIDRIKSERTVKFADQAGNTTDLTSNDLSYGSSLPSTEEIDPYLKKRDRAQTMAYNAAMNAAQVRSKVLSSREVRDSIAEARKGVKDHIASSARLAHIECVHYQLLSRTANSFVTVGGLRQLMNTVEIYMENSTSLFTVIRKLYDTQVQAYEGTPIPVTVKSKRSKSNSSSVSSANDSTTVTVSVLQKTWNVLQIVHHISHHFETVYNFLDHIISGMKARSLSYDQEFRKAKEELKSFTTDYKSAVNKCNTLEQDLDAEVAVCSSPPTPCIILLDSLKMHRGQEIARRVRFYLEAEFRARYMSPAELIAVHKLQIAQRSNGRTNVTTELSSSSSTTTTTTVAETPSLSSGTMDPYGIATTGSEPVVPLSRSNRLKSDSVSSAQTLSASLEEDESMDNVQDTEDTVNTHVGGLDDLQLQQQSTKGNDPLSMDFFLSALASAPGNRRKNLKNHTNPTTDAEKVHFAKAIIRRSKLVSAGNNASSSTVTVSGTNGKGGKNSTSNTNELTISASKNFSDDTENEALSPIIINEVNNSSVLITATSSRFTTATSWPWLSSIGSLFEASKFPCKQPEHLPRQTNDSDCGLFALQYFESFCIPMLPHVTMEHLASISRMRSIFGDFFDLREVEAKRNAIRSLILNDIAKRPLCCPPGTITTNNNNNSNVSIVSTTTTLVSSGTNVNRTNSKAHSKSSSSVIALE